MAPDQDRQLEQLIGDVLKSGDVQALEAFLQRDISEGTTIKCSQQFLAKLDRFVSRSLEQGDSKSACLGFDIICKCGKHLKLPGNGQGLSGLIAQGLIRKIKQWFEKCRQLWIQCGPQWDETLFNLSEDFFEALMVVHEACKEGTYKITESFLYPVGQLGVDPRIYILIQKEAIRKFNLILDKIPVELKKERKILTSQEASDIMIKLAGQIMQGGDYDLQTALMEALCRMATPDQRKELADQWFSIAHVATAFARVHDSEFETDCRKFLNLVNGMQGDRRRVYSYPCLEVYLDKYELLMPADEKLEEFWIDFNLGSHSISFYFSSADEETQEGQWETICINENEVQSYAVTEEGKRKILLLKLSEVVVVSGVEGSSLTIHFSSSLDILQAACSVYGHSKNKGFLGKKSTSVVKTTVKIIMEDNSSQVVPESQVSLGETEKNKASYLLPTPSMEMMTPAKMRISESAMLISNSAGGNVLGTTSLSAVMSSDNPARGKDKTSLDTFNAYDRQDEFYLGEQRAATKVCSHDTTPSSRKAGAMKEQDAAHKKTHKNKHEKNTLVAKPLEMVLSREVEEMSLDDSFVPDTQPRTRINISSNWNKVSVSEMLMMPTQKISTLPRPEPHLCLAPLQQRPSLTQRLSVPGSGPVSQKLSHTRLTQRLQQVLSEKSHNCAPQESAAPQKKKTDSRGDFKARSSAGQCASTVCTPKEQQAQRNGMAKEKSKYQTPLEESVAPNKSSVKLSTTKAKQGKIPGVEAETTEALSSKEKRDAEAAGSMVKLISSHYRFNTRSKGKEITQDFAQNSVPCQINRPSLNISWISKDLSGAVNKSHSRTATNSTRQGEDIFAFNTDAPLSIGAKDKSFVNTSAILSSDNHDSLVLHSTNKKGQPVAKQKKQYVKKHLFSDTDTDCAMTEVSWLRESSRKPRPKVNIYSRQAAAKPKAATPHTSYDSPGLHSTSPKPVKDSTKPKKKMPGVEQPKEKVKPAAVSSRLHAAGTRPKRAAAISTKSYREPNTDSSQSESEKPPVPKNSFIGQERKSQKTHSGVSDVKRRKNASKKSTDTYRRVDGNNQSDLKQTCDFKQRPGNVLKKTLKSKAVIPAQKPVNALMDSWVANHASICSTFCIERMRSADRSAPTLDLTCSPLLTPRGSPLPTSPDPACQDTPLPILLLPKPPALSSKENLKPSSFYSAQKKLRTSKTQSIQSVHALHSLGSQIPAPDFSIGPSAAEPFQQCLSPAAQSPLSLSTQPLLTSTLLELDKPSMPSPQLPFPEDAANDGSHCGFSKASTVLQDSLSQSSTKSSGLMKRIKYSPTAARAISYKTEKTSSSDSELKPEQFHESGPSRKRYVSLSSNSEGDEKEEKMKSKMRRQRVPRMKPRKLFKSFTEMSAKGALDQIVSPAKTVNTSHSEEDVGDGEMEMDEDFEFSEIAVNPTNICQKFSSELKKKFQNRNKMMEIYNKQSLKTVQQHISSLSMHVTKNRAKTLEQIKKVLLEELHKLEQDDTVLKNMEKDLSIYCKKQTMAFHLHQEKNTKRNETLKKALQSNVFPSLEYEQEIFTSQMCLIRKDMKSVQDRLLCDMQEGEIQSVKRGLHALFFPDRARF
ncbi:hypothetical protein Q8A73_014164 [Channa argus]|nr:hypothetical protein Q8A73_014164 [Channa argus]